MKVRVTKEFETEIFEISQLQEQSIPETYQEPYFIVIDSREDVRVPYQFHARKEILRKSGSHNSAPHINVKNYQSSNKR